MCRFRNRFKTYDLCMGFCEAARPSQQQPPPAYGQPPPPAAYQPPTYAQPQPSPYDNNGYNEPQAPPPRQELGPMPSQEDDDGQVDNANGNGDDGYYTNNNNNNEEEDPYYADPERCKVGFC